MTDAASCQNLCTPPAMYRPQNHSFLRFIVDLPLHTIALCAGLSLSHRSGLPLRAVHAACTDCLDCEVRRVSLEVNGRTQKIAGYSGLFNRPEASSVWKGAWLKPNTNARGAGNGTTPSWTNPAGGRQCNTWRTVRSAANPTCWIYVGAPPMADLRSMQSIGKLIRERGLFLGRPAADSGSGLVAAAPVAIESAFQHERAEVRFWLQ